MKKLIVAIILFFLFFIFTYTYAYNLEKIIYIDAGHGGFDGGASVDGIVEKDITLDVSKMLKAYLENIGYECILTRDDDSSLAFNKREDIHNRVNMINSSKCLLYISIHVNSFPETKYYGAQTFFNANNNESKKLSELIQNVLKKATNTKREAKAISNVYLVDNVNKTGALVELGFLSNDEERLKLIDKNYQDLMAYFIYIGILEYLTNL